MNLKCYIYDICRKKKKLDVEPETSSPHRGDHINLKTGKTLKSNSSMIFKSSNLIYVPAVKNSILVKQENYSIV